MDRVTVEIAEGVADVRLNRPDKLNALDPEMFEALISAGESLRRNPAVRAAVLSGNGRCFSAGLDFTAFVRMVSEQIDRSRLFAPGDGTPANFAQRAAFVWHELPVPVIAAVHGYAYGGGLQIALGADLRIVAADARLSIMEIKWGLIPDMSGTQMLRRLVRLDVAKELTFTGRTVSGTEAVAIGLATRTADDPLGAAFELAREISQKSPDAVRAAKRLLDHSGVVSVAEGLALEAELQRSLVGTPNQVEAVQANLEKRPASFKDPD